jgi:hypothetical protein
MDAERWVHPTRLHALLHGEMTLLILRATPTPTGGIPAQLGLPSGEGALGPRRRACPGGRAPSGHARRVEVPRQRCARGAGRPPGCGESLWPRVVERSIQAIGGSPILTGGTQGVFGGTLDQRVPGRALPIPVVETTTARDAWNGALAERRPLARAMRGANVAAGLACTQRRAQHALPIRAQVEALLDATRAEAAVSAGGQYEREGPPWTTSNTSHSPRRAGGSPHS